MKPIDLSKVSNSELKAEWARRNSAKRTTKTGGRNGGRPQCKCGGCKACQKRATKS